MKGEGTPDLDWDICCKDRQPPHRITSRRDYSYIRGVCILASSSGLPALAIVQSTLGTRLVSLIAAGRPI